MPWRCLRNPLLARYGSFHRIAQARASTSRRCPEVAAFVALRHPNPSDGRDR
jgi:hypothetical protein